MDIGGDVTAHWVELTPTYAVADQATLTINPDNTILASGTPLDHEMYTIKATTTLANITGFRLEAIQDPSLPGYGPGRNGNYVVYDFHVEEPLPSRIASDVGKLTLTGAVDLGYNSLQIAGAGHTDVQGTVTGRGSGTPLTFNEMLTLEDPEGVWRFNEGFGSTAVEATGSGSNGAISGALYRWYDYSRARDEMFQATDTSWAPWYVVNSNDKRCARLNLITHLLSRIPYKKVPRGKVVLPKRQKPHGYREPDYPFKVIPEKHWRRSPRD